MRCCGRAVVISTLAVAGLAAPACSESCSCPSGGGNASVAFPPAEISPIGSLTADSPCSATVGADGQIHVATDTVGTCDVHVQLENGDAYTFTIAFQSVDRGCCGGIAGKARGLVPQLGDAGTGAQGLPMVPAGCAATCSTAAGPEVNFADTSSAAAAFAGRWRICGAWPGGLPNGVVGVELAPASASQSRPDAGVTWQGGEGDELVSGASGPVPKTDFGYLVTWQVELEEPVAGPDIYFDISTGSGEGAAGVAHYSACPTRIQIDTSETNVVLVPFGS